MTDDAEHDVPPYVLEVSEDAVQLIVREEDSDEAYYRKHYTHFDWPEGASGPTVAIGYDCGYVTPGEATNDWSGIVPAETIASIVAACGLKGEAAHAFVRQHGASVTITWEQALQEFRTRELPKWIAHVARDLPNFAELSPDSRGALVSLAYNRGESFRLPGPRYSEMRAILSHMAEHRFDLVPDDILSMRRLWPAGGDLYTRREHEAALFRRGLGTPAPTQPQPAPAEGPEAEGSVKWVQDALNKALKPPLPEPLDVDGDLGPETRMAVRNFQRQAGLEVDGDPGPQTVAALKKALEAA